MHEIKSGLRISNFPAIFKNEEKRGEINRSFVNQMEMRKILLGHPVASEKMARIERRGLVKAAASFRARERCCAAVRLMFLG